MQAVVTFEKPISRTHTGKIFIRLDSDGSGWSKPVPIGIILDDIYPWISMTISMSTILITSSIVGFFCFYWAFCDKVTKAWRRRQYQKAKEKRAQMLFVEEVEEKAPAVW